MWYRFKSGSVRGVPRVTSYHVSFYDMNHGGCCFDESFFKPDDLLKAIPYVETIEDEGKDDRTRVFVHMDDGDVYELKLVKLTDEQIKKRTTRYFEG